MDGPALCTHPRALDAGVAPPVCILHACMQDAPAVIGRYLALTPTQRKKVAPEQQGGGKKGSQALDAPGGSASDGSDGSDDGDGGDEEGDDGDERTAAHAAKRPRHTAAAKGKGKGGKAGAAAAGEARQGRGRAPPSEAISDEADNLFAEEDEDEDGDASGSTGQGDEDEDKDEDVVERLLREARLASGSVRGAAGGASASSGSHSVGAPSAAAGAGAGAAQQEAPDFLTDYGGKVRACVIPASLCITAAVCKAFRPVLWPYQQLRIGLPIAPLVGWQVALPR